ncbi:MAG: glycosyltransferase [Acidobacteria bacterium]|nr:glycosyltransferase [Acidobacteriota bacterium]
MTEPPEDRAAADERLRREVEALRESRDFLESQNASLRGELETVSSRLGAIRRMRWWRLGVALRNLLVRPRSAARALAGRRAGQRSGAVGSQAGASRRSPSIEAQRRIAGVTSAPRRPGDLWVAAILDEMSRACFAPECNLITFRPDSWRAVLEERRPHLLLVESAWEGGGGSWQYQVGTYSYGGSVGLPSLSALVRWCRAEGIPTVFWNKEDPIHFDRFKEAAALFDIVFTSDSNSIPRYERIARARSARALPFAAQPRIHNPIGPVEARRDEPVFAGTYYRNRHPERRAQLEGILDAARPYGLVIYDRMGGREDDSFGFPDRFKPHIAGHLPYGEVVEAYKRHKVFLNANSVTDSPTMFSRRVFELLACGTAVVSTPSRGIREMFGDLVAVVETEAEARGAIERLLHDEPYRRAVTSAGVRLVLAEHTYRERLAAIAGAAGFAVDPRADEAVAVLAVLDDPEGALRLAEQVASQTRAPAEIVVGAAGGALSDRLIEELRGRFGGTSFRVIEQEGASAAPRRRRELAALAASPWVAPLDPGERYEATYLQDLAACTRFADAEVVGKASFLAGEPAVAVFPELENRYTTGVHPHAAIARREVVAARGWPDSGEANAAFRAWFAEGVRFYGALRDGFVAAAGAAPAPIEPR